MKIKVIGTVFIALLVGSVNANTESTFANGATIYVKPSQLSLKANDEVRFDFYIESASDLFGCQFDVATSLNPGGLPFEPTNKTTPFKLEEKSIFANDLALVNKYDSTKEITSLLVTRQLTETSGYSVTALTFLASLSLKALTNMETLNTVIKVSDDLLSMQLGITNITVKLSTAIGQKITYLQGEADILKPIITIPNKTQSILVNGSFNPLNSFTVTDNRTIESKLEIYVSNFHRVDQQGEYILTIMVMDEFQNMSLDWFTLVVGQPYTNIEVEYVSN